MKDDQELYGLSEMGEGSGRRLCLSFQMSGPELWRFCLGRSIGPDEIGELVAEADAESPREDFPWADSRAQVVSTRLRGLLEKHAPGHAQFLPLKVVRKGREVFPDEYWVVNWLRFIDCIDLKRSNYKAFPDASRDGGVYYSFNRIVLDTSRVPQDVLVFRLRHYNVRVVVRQQLRELLEKAGVTGPQYDVMHQV